MPRLTHCVPAPSRWGARHVQGATYLDLDPWPHHDLPGTRVNEWLLQYPNASAAHRVLVNTLQRLKSCPEPAGASDDPTNINRNRDSSWDYDEAFGSRRTWYKNSAHRGLPVARYVFFTRCSGPKRTRRTRRHGHHLRANSFCTDHGR